MSKVDVQRLYSWLQYLDIEYLDDELAQRLSSLDINDTAQHSIIIEAAIEPEFKQLNEKSKKSLQEILRECMNLSDNELEAVFVRVGMPFRLPLVHRAAFLREIWVRLFGLERLHQ